MKNALIKALLFSCLSLVAQIANSEDIDLFVGAPASTNSLPNVLIILDNTANWSQPFNDEIEALTSVLSFLPEDQFNVGLMMFNETGGGDSGNNGAYVRAAIRPMNADNKTTYINLIKTLDVNADKANNGKVGMSMWEAYLYFAGLAPHAGNNKAKTDYRNNIDTTTSRPDARLANNAIYALGGNALSSKAGSTYLSPTSLACTKNYIIYISNGAAQDNNSDISSATAALANLGGDITTIPISPTGSQVNVADEWARFMKKSPLNISTFTIDINKVTTGQGPGFTALLKSMANQSGGTYFDVNVSQVAGALTTIFSQIQSVNSVFASVSLPISVNTQGTLLNRIYIGMFRPDKAAAPSWNGNLKQYQLGFKDDNLQLLDADNNSALNTSNTGFIAECARSFWTPQSTDNYWEFKPEGNCLTVNTAASNSPDGNVVEKGGQGFRLRSDGGRTMLTCSSITCNSLYSFNSSLVTTAELGTTTSNHELVVKWQQGFDIKNELGNANFPSNALLTNNMRPSVHGDVVHSRPIAINYGNDAAPQVVVFYGGNDGALRAVNGNRNTSIGNKAAGSELWSFVPPEFYRKIIRLYDNSPIIKFPGQSSAITPTPIPKDYGMDGPITAFKNNTNATIYAAMRRGGRAVYAFDVTTPTALPSLKWKIGCPNATNDTNCTTNYSELGQTWSSPTVIKASGFTSAPLLIMGGGYDTCHDANSDLSCGTTSKGKKIYIINASTGTLLKSFNTISSVIADITVVPDTNGNIKFAYVADLGGNIYRVSGENANTAINNTIPSNWTMTRIASLGGTGADNRKFMFAPDVLDDNGTYNLLIGSGDREKPLSFYTSATTVNNRFYLIKDNPNDSTWLTSETINCGTAVICHNSLVAITSNETPTDATLSSSKGWYLALSSTEQVVTSAITVFGTVTFSTHKPAAAQGDTCSTLGTATVYNINYTNAAPLTDIVRGQVLLGGGLPPSPVAGLVTLDDGKTVPFLIGGRPDSPLQASVPQRTSPKSVIRPKSRVFWNIRK
jgi:type IV pilus assembly protein PilY1